MSGEQPSTLGSYINSATATVQNAVGSLTGNPVDKQQAADKHLDAQAERDASRAGAKVGPVNLSTSGATLDNEDRREGRWDQKVGSGKEFVGNVVGSDSLKSEGRQQNQKGEGQEAAGQLKDYAQGAYDRVAGAVGSAVSSVTGNTSKETEFQRQHDTGKTNVRGVEAEVSKD